MKVCFYNMNHIGDIYFSSFFIRLICDSNKDKQFYYYFINGDIFFKNIENIKRINKIDNHYSDFLINGGPPENLLDNTMLQILINNGMQFEGAKIIQVDDENILFINTWCASKYFNITDFHIGDSITSYRNLIQTINTDFNLNLIFSFSEPKELLKDNDYYNKLFSGKYNDMELNDTIFIFNYFPRSLRFDMNNLKNYILESSKNNKIVLACYDSTHENNDNVKFIDREYNIKPVPSCDNLIEIWEIAIKCKKIIILPTGGSWTFFHKINEIKENQLFIFDDSGNYLEKLNSNINLLVGEKTNLIQML